MGTSFEDVRLARARVAVEASGSANFAIDQTGSPSNFVDIPFIEGTVQQTRDQAHLDPQSLQQYLDARESEVLGPKSAKVTASTVLASHGLSMDGTTAAASRPVLSGTGVAWWMARVLATVMGGYNIEAGGLGAQTKVVSGSSPTGVTVTAAHGARFTPGCVVGFLNASGLLECTVVKTVSTDTLTFKQALSFTPTAPSAVVYSGPTVYLTEDPQTSLQLWVEGEHDYQKYALLGQQGTPGFDIKLGDLPKLTLNLAGPKFVKETNSAIAAASYSLFSPFAVKDSALYVSTVGNTTRTTVQTPGFTVQPQIAYEMIRGLGGVETVLRQRRVRKSPAVQGALDVYWDNTYDWDAAHDSKTQLMLFFQGGSAPGSTVCIEISTAQAQPPQDKAQGSVSGRTVPWRSRLDQEIGQSSEMNRSALRVSFL